MNLESVMVSVERSFLVKDLEPEKELRSEYDAKMIVPELVEQ